MFRIFVRKRRDVAEESKIQEYEYPPGYANLTSFLERSIDTRGHAKKLASLLTQDLGLEYQPYPVWYVEPKSKSALALRELKNSVGMVLFAHVMDPPILAMLCDNATFTTHVIKVVQTIDSSIVSNLMKDGFQELYDRTDPNLESVTHFTTCTDSRFDFGSQLWCDADHEGFFSDDPHPDADEDGPPYLACNDVTLLVDVPLFVQHCSVPYYTRRNWNHLPFQIYATVANNPFSLGTIDLAYTTFPPTDALIALASQSMPRSERNYLAAKSQLYAIAISLRTYVFVDSSEVQRLSTDAYFIPVYDANGKAIGYRPRPRKITDFKVARFPGVPDDVLMKQLPELERIRTLSALFLQEWAELASYFAQYTKEFNTYDYKRINAFLRGIVANDADVWKQNEDLVERLSLMLEAMFDNGITNKEPLILYRGIRETHWDRKKGESWIEGGFLSTSTSALENFRTNSCCLIVVHVPAGTPMLHLESVSIQREDEFLLVPGLQIHINGVYPIDDQDAFSIVVDCSVVANGSLTWLDWKQKLHKLNVDLVLPQQVSQKQSDFSLLTINVQTYLEASQKEIATKINTLHADIVCTQEDVLHDEMHSLNGLKLIAGCMTGEDTNYDGKMTNSIYARERPKKIERLDISDNCPVGRCAVIVTLSNGIKLANVHLCGGRFDDRQFRRLRNVKEEQLQSLVELHDPDMIVGDFNGEPSVGPSLRTHPVYMGLNDEDRALYETYHTSGHSYLLSKGYADVLSSLMTFVPTSRFGGQPDHIYFKSKSSGIRLTKTEIVSFQGLTDHQGILARFTSS